MCGAKEVSEHVGALTKDRGFTIDPSASANSDV